MAVWGFIGAGTVSTRFAESLRLTAGAQMRGVFSRTRAHAESFAARFRISESYATIDALLDDDSIDVVYIGTPTALHDVHALQAIEAGKAVLVEKPLAVDAARARAVAEAARKAGVFCMEGMWTRFIPAIREVKSRLEAGEIGEPIFLRASLGFAVDPDPDKRFFNAALGGGALLDLGVYPISLACHLFGRPTIATGCITPSESGIDTQASLTLSFDGKLASLDCNFNQRMDNEALVVGTRGQIRIAEPLYAPTRVDIRLLPDGDHTNAESGNADRSLADAPIIADWHRRLLPIARRLLRRPRRLHFNFPGFGYQFEAEEVEACLAAGVTESQIMPLDDSILALEIIDKVRASAGSKNDLRVC